MNTLVARRLIRGTSKTGDTGPCRYVTEDDLLDNSNSKDLQVMRGNEIQSTVEKTAFGGSRATSFISTGVKPFPYDPMNYFRSDAGLNRSLHPFC